MMISPTGNAIRTSDAHGRGAYGAKRGRRSHRGTDFICEPGQNIVCPIDRAILVRECRPYVIGPYSGALLKNDDLTIKMFYFTPWTDLIGADVRQGDVLGIAQNISTKYPGMTNHIHLEIVSINPELFLRLP